MVIQGGFSKLERRKGSGVSGAGGSTATSTTTAEPAAEPESMVYTDSWLLHLRPILEGKPPTWERLTSSVPRSQQEELVSSGRNPIGRCGTSSAVHKDRLVVAGGVIDKEHYHHKMESVFYNDLHALDIEKRKWFPIRTNNSDREGQKRQSRGGKNDGEDADSINDSDLEQEDDEEDEAEVNNENSGWDIQKLRSNMFAFLDGEGNLVYEKDAVVKVVDGLGNNEQFEEKELSSKVLKVDPETKTLKPSASSEPLPRIKAMLFLSGHTLYLYGGLVEVGDREVTLDDMWCIDLKKKRAWECLYEGTMHQQVWRGGEDDDDESYVSTGDRSEGAKDDDDDDEEEEGDDGGKEVLTEEEVREIEELKAKHNLGDSDIPAPNRGESLADFYARSGEHWNRLAAAENSASGDGGESLFAKELKRQGFALARQRFEEVEPVIERIHELNLEQDAASTPRSSKYPRS